MPKRARGLGLRFEFGFREGDDDEGGERMAGPRNESARVRMQDTRGEEGGRPPDREVRVLEATFWPLM